MRSVTNYLWISSCMLDSVWNKYIDIDQLLWISVYSVALIHYSTRTQSVHTVSPDGAHLNGIKYF